MKAMIHFKKMVKWTEHLNLCLFIEVNSSSQGGSSYTRYTAVTPVFNITAID